jgi:hypothetical protein
MPESLEPVGLPGFVFGTINKPIISDDETPNPEEERAQELREERDHQFRDALEYARHLATINRDHPDAAGRHMVR